jgi:hypothetical protein
MCVCVCGPTVGAVYGYALTGAATAVPTALPTAKPSAAPTAAAAALAFQRLVLAFDGSLNANFGVHVSLSADCLMVGDHIYDSDAVLDSGTAVHIVCMMIMSLY